MSSVRFISARSMLACRILAIATLLVALLHCISYFLVDPMTILLGGHTELRGVGLYLGLDGPVFTADWLAPLLAAIDYILPAVVYLGIFLIFVPLSRGQVFEPVTFRGVRFLAWSTLLVPVQHVRFNTLVPMTPPGFEIAGELAFAITYEQFLFLFVGICLVVLARVFSHAVELARENEGFV